MAEVTEHTEANCATPAPVRGFPGHRANRPEKSRTDARSGRLTVLDEMRKRGEAMAYRPNEP